MTPAVLLRALEPADLAALKALCERPEIAPTLERVPSEKSLQSAPGVNVAIGAFDGARLVGAAGMSARDRPRLRHTGQAWLASGAAAAAPLLEALRGLACDWWKLDRLELVLPASAGLGDVLEEASFEEEVRRRLDLAGPSGHEDSVGYAWIRGGLAVAPSGRAFPRGSTGALPGPLAIRPANPQDAAAFARIFAEQSTVWGTLQCPFTPAEVWRARLEGNESSGTKAFAATLGDEIVGLANLHPAAGPRRLHVRTVGMAVAGAWQGRGVGRALMQQLMHVGDALGVDRLELEVYADNDRAIALYERFGFLREGLKQLEAWRQNAYVDTLVMGRLRPFTGPPAAASPAAGGPP